MNTCEDCGSDEYCKHCSTCHNCLGEWTEMQEGMLAAAKKEIAELKSDLEFMCKMHDRGIYWQSDADRINSMMAKHKGE